MYGIDPPTLIIVVSFLTLLLAVVMVAMRAGFPRDIRGIRQWALAIVLFVSSTPLFGQQQDWHPFISVVVANSLILAAALLMTWGMLRFVGRPIHHLRWIGLAMCTVLAAVAWFSLVQPSFHTRLVTMSLTMGSVFAYLAWLPLRYGSRGLGSVITSLAFGYTSANCLLRVVTVVSGLSRPSELLDFNTLQVLYLASFNGGVLIGSLGFILMANERLRSILEFNASHDALTGALNRGAFFRLAHRHFEQCRATRRAFSVMLLDLDHFKLINDEHGHAVGDRVLQSFALGLQGILGPRNALGRYGGEEFVVLLPDTSRTEARELAQRLRAAIQPSKGLPDYTVSIGFASITPRVKDIDELLNGADKALYMAKHNGRDRVEEWGWSTKPADDPFKGAARGVTRGTGTR